MNKRPIDLSSANFITWQTKLLSDAIHLPAQHSYIPLGWQFNCDVWPHDIVTVLEQIWYWGSSALSTWSSVVQCPICKVVPDLIHGGARAATDEQPSGRAWASLASLRGHPNKTHINWPSESTNATASETLRQNMHGWQAACLANLSSSHKGSHFCRERVLIEVEASIRWFLTALQLYKLQTINTINRATSGPGWAAQPSIGCPVTHIACSSAHKLRLVQWADTKCASILFTCDILKCTEIE